MGTFGKQSVPSNGVLISGAKMYLIMSGTAQAYNIIIIIIIKNVLKKDSTKCITILASSILILL